MQVWIEIGILLILVLINAFFAASEIALISLNDNKVKAWAEEGQKRAKLLYKLLKEPSRFLATIQIGITLAGFLASAFAAETFAERLTDYAVSSGVPVPSAWMETLSLISITLVLSYFTLVFGELVPKRIAMNKAEPISMVAAHPLNALSIIAYPFVKLLTLSTNMTVRLFGVDPHKDEQHVTEEEIRMMIDVGNERGTIQERERTMIENIFEFDNKTVSDIMTHRTNITAIPIDAAWEDVVHLMDVEKFSRYPVYEENIDQIIGILHVKDVIRIAARPDGPFPLREIIRKPLLVPESKRTDVLLRELQQHQTHIAVVVDEYGGTAGIVTIEDLLEEIVGNIFDEHDVEEKEIVKVDEQTYQIKGTAGLHEIRDFFGIHLPVEEYDTISGFIIGQLGRIPDEGEEAAVEWEDLILQVEKSDDRRILEVKVLLTPDFRGEPAGLT